MFANPSRLDLVAGNGLDRPLLSRYLRDLGLSRIKRGGCSAIHDQSKNKFAHRPVRKAANAAVEYAYQLIQTWQITSASTCERAVGKLHIEKTVEEHFIGLGNAQHALHVALALEQFVAIADQLYFGGELSRHSFITTLGALEQHEIAVFMSENLARQLRSIQIVVNVYEIAHLDKGDTYEESVEGWPENPYWPELSLLAKDPG